MIEQLVINWSAQFFVRAKPLNDAAIESLFSALPATVKNAGKDLFRAVRRTHKGKKYSAICFPYDRQPVFLAEEAGITFYHAKHGKLSLGAGAFHISVSQAEKNLGRLALPKAAIDVKFDGWEKEPYKNSNKVTAIARLMRGGPKADIEKHLARLRNSPEVVKRVSIVTSSLSKKAVENAFADIKNGKRPTAHFVQLYWLLTSFSSHNSLAKKRCLPSDASVSSLPTDK